MPRQKSRSFIKPGEGKKFKLVNRSIRDLGGYVDGAGQHVLAPIDEKYEDMDEADRRNMEKEFGVDFSDGYNYLQHLKERSDEATVWVSADNKSVYSVATSVSRASRSSRMSQQFRGKFFETEDELPQGHFQELAAERNDLPFDFDPEVAAQLDGVMDDSEMLVNPAEDEMDDFDTLIEMANVEGDDDDDEAYGTGEQIGMTDKNFIMERFALDGGFGGGEYGDGHQNDMASDEEEEDEKKTRFTAYSMSSSIMRRSVKLENLDDHFEEFFAKFDEDEIGALPHKNLADNEVELDSELLQNMMQQDYETFIPKVQHAIELAKNLNLGEDVLRIVENQVDTDSDDEAYEMVTTKPKPKWDCETICSTYSNLYNRPKIVEDGFSTRSGKPKPNTKGNRKVMFGSALKELESEYQGERNELKTRPQARKKDETLEEKKARKQLVKLAKRERRIEKKETQTAFADEFRQEAKRDMAGQSIKLN